MEKIQNSIHIKAYIKIRELSLSLHTFRENYKSLKQHLDKNNDLDYHFQFEYNSPLRWQYHPLQQETHRLLLNFVSSAIALIDHTRNMTNKLYNGSKFQREYQAKVNQELKASPVNKFVQDLRSYILHNKFPFVGTQFNHKRVSPPGDPECLITTTIRLTLNIDTLLNSSDKWTELSRKYLKSQGKQLFLDSLADEYYLLIEHFHLWLNQQQKAMHKSHYSQLLDEWDSLYQELDTCL